MKLNNTMKKKQLLHGVSFAEMRDYYKELDHMPGNGENYRLGMSKKMPDYEDVTGKETKLEE